MRGGGRGPVGLRVLFIYFLFFYIIDFIIYLVIDKGVFVCVFI